MGYQAGRRYLVIIGDIDPSSFLRVIAGIVSCSKHHPWYESSCGYVFLSER
jgi:hypothetical protein